MKLADLHPRNRGGDGLVGAANLRRRIGLHVPGVEVARSATQKDKDAGLLGRTLANSSVAIDTRGNHPRQAPGQGTDPASLEQPSAGDHDGPLSPVAEGW